MQTDTLIDRHADRHTNIMLTFLRGEMVGKMNSLVTSQDSSRMMPYTHIARHVNSCSTYEYSHQSFSARVPTSFAISATAKLRW